MKTMNEEEVLTEIMDSKVFSRVFNECRSSEIKKIFIELAVKSSTFSSTARGHVKELKETGYRLAKAYTSGRKTQNYCMYTLYSQQNKIAIDLRTDGTPITSDLIEFKNKGDCYGGGFEWNRFYINNISQIPEALRLIEYCYKI